MRFSKQHPLLKLALRAAMLAAFVWLQTDPAPPPVAQAAPAAVNWPRIYLTEVYDGFTRPVHIANAGDDSNRLFIVEQPGIIRIIENGVVLGTPFLNISSSGTNLVRYSDGEEGLLSVAFPPGYPTAPHDHFYVYYTSRIGDTDGDNVVARYELTSANDADESSEEIVLVLEHPGESNHNGGQLAFGPGDGYLYIGPGDGGGGGDQNNNAQSTDRLLGKILRLDVETGDPVTYTLPATNPYTMTVGFRGEIWALGLRNPWRFSFDRDTHDLYIGDVGQGSWEEIDFQPASDTGTMNYGWRCYEGNHDYNISGCQSMGFYDSPIWEYDRPSGVPCRSVTGGFVYRGSEFPLLQGTYLYADWCTGEIWGLKNDGTWQNKLLVDFSDFSFSSFGEDEAGELYVAHRGAGEIYRITTDKDFLYTPLVLKN